MCKFLFLLLFLPKLLISQEGVSMNTYEQLSHATFQIVTIKKLVDAEGNSRKRRFRGTGFIVELNKGGNKIEMLITNKHVIENAMSGELTFTIKKEYSNEPDFGKKHIIKIADFEAQFLKHPDKSVDLCGIRMSILWDEFDKAEITPFYMTIPESFIASTEDLKNYSQGSQILMVGYPRGLIDTTNNAPIFRKGTCATSPYLDYNGKEDFLIDIAMFNGSSGSPIFQISNKMTSTKNNNEVTLTTFEDFKLIGIVYQSPMYKVSLEGNKIDKGAMSNKNLKDNELRFPMNLGIVIKGFKILDLKDILE